MDFIKRVEAFSSFIEQKHLAELLEGERRGRLWLYLNFKHLIRWDPELADDLLSDPEESIKAAEVACEAFLADGTKEIKIRIKNLPKSSRIRIRDIRSEHIGRLVVLEGALKSKSSVRPQVTSAKFECPSCGNIIPVFQLENKFLEPTRCGCGRKGKFRMISKDLVDVQSLTIEEDVSEIGDDTNTQKFKVMLCGSDLVRPELEADLVPPNSIRVVGQIKEAPIILRTGAQSTKFDLYLEANSYEPIEDNIRRVTFDKADIETFKELAADPDLLRKLRCSVAPHLYGMERIKEAVLLFIVKGVKKESADKTIRCRDFFHVLLIGDPGSGKSEFGKEVKKISYKCKRAVGKGASGVGLTVSAEKDELLGERVLTAGTIPTCNGGHCVIDEVDKIDEEVQSHMLDCMEEGSITISKSKVQGTVKAEVGIFTIANPKYGRFVLETPLANQINLISPLVSRYDLIIPVIDEQDEERDKCLVDAIFSKHSNIAKVSERDIDYGLLRKYLFYVSMNIRPKLSDASLSVIKKFVLGLRENGKSKGVVSITPRQIEGPIRLTEAYAKLRMADETSVDDAMNAIRLIRYSLEKFGFDNELGVVDVDLVESGQGASHRSAISMVKDAMENLVIVPKKGFDIVEIVKYCGERGVSENRVDEAIARLRNNREIFEPRSGFIQKID